MSTETWDGIIEDKDIVTCVTEKSVTIEHKPTGLAATCGYLDGGSYAAWHEARVILDTKLKIAQRELRNAGRKPLIKGAIHLKTGELYLVTGYRTNATNAQNGQIMVEYERDGQLYTREATEFWEKFEEVTFS